MSRDECSNGCEAVVLPGAVLCPTCAAKELRERLSEVLGSATPNPVDHPTMTWAWERARRTPERVGGDK